MTSLTNFSFAMMPAVISLRIHPGRMAFALGIIIRDKLLALADKVTARLNADCDLDGDCEGNRLCAVRNPAGPKAEFRHRNASACGRDAIVGG